MQIERICNQYAGRLKIIIVRLKKYVVSKNVLFERELLKKIILIVLYEHI